MNSAIEIKKVFDQRSERVKSVDIHPTEPWVLLGLYSGKFSIWNYQSRVTENSLEIVEVPVRTAKFVTRKEWIVVGSDDGFIRVYNYKTMERVVEFKAHTDYIRSLAEHPTLPYILSAADDKLVKLWDWENGWECTQTFEGHEHYVMQVAFNPKDTNVFASASLDGTLKTWNLRSSIPRSSIEGRSKGLNSVAFSDSTEELYFVTGSDDHTAKVWNYDTEACVKTLEGHTHNVTSILCVKSDTKLIVTGSEDGTVRVWNSTTYGSFTSKLGRVWTVGFIRDSKQVILGCDDGMVVCEVISTSA